MSNKKTVQQVKEEYENILNEIENMRMEKEDIRVKRNQYKKEKNHKELIALYRHANNSLKAYEEKFNYLLELKCISVTEQEIDIALASLDKASN